MKRDAQDSESPHVKRPRHDDNDDFPKVHPDRQHSQIKHNERPAEYRQNNPKEWRANQRPQKGHFTRKPAPAHTPAAASISQDPLVALKTLLQPLAAHPDEVEKTLGSSASKYAGKLLISLSSADVSPKAWLDIFQPTSLQQPAVQAYATPRTSTQHTKSTSLPPLPEVPDGPYLQATFTHKSTTQHDRVSGTNDLTYEKLEFLGDAYIEIIATRIIFDRYPNLPAGRQAQTRERLVKNETLAHFSTEYGFRNKIQANDLKHSKNGGVKILADVFEAYVAAVVLSDPQDGFRRVEEWLTDLWAPILMQEFTTSTAPTGEKAPQEYNSNAKPELQKLILGHDTKLEYVEDRPMEQSKHEQKYFIGLYLTGYGYEKKKIGYGEGRNKVEAGNRAAMMAFQDNRAIVDDAATQLKALKERKRLEKEERERNQADDSGSRAAVVDDRT